jgi:hypothetical protein
MIIDFNNNLVSDAVLEEEEYIPKGFIPEKEENMEFIKLGDKYLIKDSNGKVINEKEKLELEKQGIVLEDITSNNCQEENTKKIKKIKKEVKKIEDAELSEVTGDAVIKETI